MALPVTTALDEINHAVPGGMSEEIDSIALINRAGEFFVGIHRWAFLIGREAFLDLRGAITLTGASWVSDTKTLTKAGAFADYTFLSGDRIEITSGTGATTGRYTIASRSNDNAIVLSTTFGADATDIAGTMRLDFMALPSDFGEALSVRYDDTIFNGFRLTSMAHLNQMRAIGTEVDGPWYYNGAIGHAGSPPNPILEHYPRAGSNVNEAFRLVYRAGWSTVSGDTDTLEIESYANQAFLSTVRAFAKGYEDESDGLALDAYLASVVTGPVMLAAKSADGFQHGNVGRIRNGAISGVNRRGWPGLLRTRVAAPG